jgi:hypothetical protein
LENIVAFKIRTDLGVVRFNCRGCGRFLVQGTPEQVAERVRLPEWHPDAVVCPVHGLDEVLEMDDKVTQFVFEQRSL